MKCIICLIIGFFIGYYLADTVVINHPKKDFFDEQEAKRDEER